MKIKDLKKELEQAQEKHKKIAAQLEDSDHPQTKESYTYNAHVYETLQAVIARINGDRLALELI